MAHADGTTQIPSHSRVHVAAIALIPVGWFVAMAVARQGSTSVVMAAAAVALCLFAFASGALETPVLAPSGRSVILGIAAALLMIAGTWVGYALVSRIYPSMLAETATLYEYLNGEGWGLAIVIVAVVGEEILWRGAFHGWVSARLRQPIAATVVSSIVYAAAMASFGSPLLVAVALTCGLYWSALRSWSGSVVAPLIAHVLWDVAIILVPLRA